MEEKTLLKTNANEIGMNIDLIPKCQTELEVEGIECMWAYIKNLHRRREIVEKRGKERLISAVKDLLNFASDDVKLSRKFYKKARSYMIPYDMLDKQQPDKTNSYQLIEKSRKFYTQSKKFHRSIDDSEKRYINSLINQRTEM